MAILASRNALPWAPVGPMACATFMPHGAVALYRKRKAVSVKCVSRYQTMRKILRRTKEQAAVWFLPQQNTRTHTHGPTECAIDVQGWQVSPQTTRCSTNTRKNLFRLARRNFHGCVALVQQRRRSERWTPLLIGPHT